MNGFRIAHVRGIDIRLNWSVALTVILLSWSLADVVFPEAAPGYSSTTYWTVAVLTALALLGALAAHELGHSLAAHRRSVEVERVTLWALGGVAELGSRPATARDAMRIAAAGPVVSATLGVIALGLGLVLSDLAQVAVVWFGSVNCALAVFNLLPAFPLDGGRIYQAYHWHRSNSELEATKKATALGQLLGGALVGVGAIEVLTGFATSGLWSVVIGLFIREAGRSELRAVTVAQQLEHLTVEEVMTPNPACVSAGLTIEHFVDDLFVTGRHAAYPMLGGSDELVGLVTMRQIRAVPRTRWATTQLLDVGTPVADLAVAKPTDSAASLIDLVQRPNGERSLVVAEGALVGIVAPSDVARVMSYMDLTAPELGTEGPSSLSTQGS